MRETLLALNLDSAYTWWIPWTFGILVGASSGSMCGRDGSGNDGLEEVIAEALE
jgi:hypothetical protein